MLYTEGTVKYRTVVVAVKGRDAFAADYRDKGISHRVICDDVYI